MDGHFINGHVHRGASEEWCTSYDYYCNTTKSSTSKLSNNLLPPTLPVVIYEDDHIAIVNKPGGVNLYTHSIHSIKEEATSATMSMSIKDMLPYILKPPVSNQTNYILPNPEPTHRLDKLTSGLLLVAKTRPSLRALSTQFHDRIVEKTYTAICYGVPVPVSVSVPVVLEGDMNWNIIDQPLDGKSAITYWRLLEKSNTNNTIVATSHHTHYQHNSNRTLSLSLVELKPKTGRYRQLRRHMAKSKGCPLVGDNVFAKGMEVEKETLDFSIDMTELGLFLCSNEVTFEHPHYKASEYNRSNVDLSIDGKSGHGSTSTSTSENSNVRICLKGEKVMITARIELPQKFATLLK